MTRPRTTTPAQLPLLLFESTAAWSAWLDDHAGETPGVWLRIARKNAPLESLTYADALDVALCHGWIDSQKKGYDETSWLQKFTPRGPKSLWSRVNREKAQELMAAGRMRPAGLREVERAKEDGRWEAAYDSQRTATVPEDLRAELDRNPAAREFFAALDSANRYAILFRIQTARRPETRARKIAELVSMLARNEKIHP